ncbi:M24 family metallopeptidase [Neorhizobium galegae]|uniref:M24 family metallopeptidase n=1 Tax=Neorhizobium galegae TaxID=399 RepID=UPI00210779AE|nr:Xaa-Pro peptidase family protein [Neorhizobium galegae]MCQ1853492.1 Xaa-Pro peptidase family protein [Neorhizobium galegae]
MGFSQRLAPEFYQRLHRDIRARMEEKGVGLLILDAADDVLYTTGFSFRPNERPVALALTATAAILLIPELEREHAERQDMAAETLVYFEFPGVDRAFSLLARSIGEITGDIAHSSGLSVGRAAELAGLFPNNRVMPTDIVARMRQVKYPEELRLHREAARISDAMVQSGVDLVTEAFRAGKPLPSEIALEAHVVRHALDIMENEHEDIMNVPTLAGGLVYGGPNSAYPHGIISHRRIQPGESFILSLGCRVGGRSAESERTFVLGEPSKEHKKYYAIAQEAQRLGTTGLVAGRTCASADISALAYIREQGMGPYLKHRVGHGMGVAFHEPPWIEAGDQTILQEGMICSSEPALYVPEVGGFRLADTVLVTGQGPDSLTKFPRRFEEIVLS